MVQVYADDGLGAKPNHLLQLLTWHTSEVFAQHDLRDGLRDKALRVADDAHHVSDVGLVQAPHATKIPRLAAQAQCHLARVNVARPLA